ncbi:MAG: helix-turn-helix domain-containing protein [Microcoleus sp. PH2017_01_SCD_O_A]|jgi:putative transcriptional regulator|uniref:helix-turn-helix transcriptional regulator n=1 Tax=Microcoleus sp. PH2017_01_SCD_O_A TaxID=2798812 RepID=UPI001DEBA379|nr:helix-turn-helix transcriptional regulator [Microcoleus sp. PH2017_01_SCD_O_A]MCC3427299.1 helix-turn-helix domain-containing protein [Microcoleus sp. PH2017_01_SCD_O_A]
MVKKRQRQRQPENELPFRRLREDANFSQEELAVLIGVSASSVRRWEKGDEPTMTIRQIRDFCRLVGVSFDELPDYLSRWVDEEES